MNYEGHLLVGPGSLCAFLLAADIAGFAPVPAPVTLAAGLGMAALGAIAVDIDHPEAFISATAPKRLFKVGIRLLVFISIPAIITIASSRRVNLMGPDQLLQADIFRLLAVVTIGAAGLFALSRLIQVFFIHRGPIHSPAFFVGVTMVVTLLLKSEKFSLLPGCLLAPARILVMILSALSVVLLVARFIKLF